MPLIFILHVACFDYSFFVNLTEEAIAQAIEDYPLQKGPWKTGPFLFIEIL